MSELVAILKHMADDRAFATLVETDPASALRDLNLTTAELHQIEEAIASARGVVSAAASQPNKNEE